MSEFVANRRRMSLMLGCTLALAGCSGGGKDDADGRPAPTVGIIVAQPGSAAIPATLAGRVVIAQRALKSFGRVVEETAMDMYENFAE